jgi:Lrp/AsnC family leucine-responsive transcriptional regulator
MVQLYLALCRKYSNNGRRCGSLFEKRKAKQRMTFQQRRLLDETGWRILEELQHDARLTFQELGQRVGLSSPAVNERVRKLEDAGIITGYGAKIDYAKVGLPIMAIMRLTTPINPWPQASDLTKDVPELLEFHRVTGGDSYIMKVVVASIAHLEWVIDRLVPYGPLTTSIVLSSLLHDQPLTQEVVGRVEKTP